MIPTTADEWWAQVEEYNEELLALVEEFHPCYCNQHDFKITASAAEDICEEARENIRINSPDDSPSQAFEIYRKTKDPKLATLLNKVWFGMPESREVRSYPGFSVLCNLCSEAYVLYEEEHVNDDDS